MKKTFTEDEKQIIEKMYLDYERLIDIKKVIGCSYDRVVNYLKDAGIYGRDNTKVNGVNLHGARKYYFNEEYFRVIDTEDKAYWLGFLFADGYVYDNDEKNYHRVKLRIKASDENHLIKFLNCTNSNQMPKKIDTLLNGNICYSSEIDFYSKQMVKDLVDKGCVQNKSLILKRPSNIPQHLERHFIRGYFDGDGSIYYDVKRNRFQFTILGTNDLLNWIVSKFDIENYQIRNAKNNTNCMELRICKKSVCNKIYNYLFDNSNIYLDRKYHIAKSMNEWALM